MFYRSGRGAGDQRSERNVGGFLETMGPFRTWMVLRDMTACLGRQDSNIRIPESRRNCPDRIAIVKRADPGGGLAFSVRPIRWCWCGVREHEDPA